MEDRTDHRTPGMRVVVAILLLVAVVVPLTFFTTLWGTFDMMTQLVEDQEQPAHVQQAQPPTGAAATPDQGD